MCGIIGVISKQDNIVGLLIDGLKRLEYRGYDSAGIAVLSDDKIQSVRKVGRVALMEQEVKSLSLESTVGIGHTRWATHGKVCEMNAHPIISNDLIAVVHNGIIENFEIICNKLKKLGYHFKSQTDTEAVAHLIHYYYLQTNSLFDATVQACNEFEGAFAICVIAKSNSDEMIVARMGCPLLIALGEGKTLVASDVSAVVSYSRDVIYLEDKDIALVSALGIEKIVDKDRKEVQRRIHRSHLSLASLELGPYSHFMQKEINEQPRSISDTVEAVFSYGFTPLLFGEKAQAFFEKVRAIKILACGTSYYAGLVARIWLEEIAKIPTSVEIASEYRYMEGVHDPATLIVTISQSGETLDTLEALKYEQKKGPVMSLSVCNVMESALPRASNLQFFTRAGIEIGVASTKAFTTQLVAMFTLAVTLGKMKNLVDEKKVEQYLEDLRYLPGYIQQALDLESQITLWSQHIAHKDNILFLGRGLHYPIALEGALKLKEITYIHAEGYPAGELKHGPLALVDKDIIVVATVPNDAYLNKLKSNLAEVKARNGKLYLFADSDSNLNSLADIEVIRTPKYLGVLSPIVHAIPVQLLAYHTALEKGTDVDKPRNLAKSVTVE